MPNSAPRIPDRTRVLVAEDSRSWQMLLVELITGCAELELVGLAATVASTIEQLTATQPDVLVLDWNLREGAGSEVLSARSRVSPRSKVVVFTMNDSTRDQETYRAKGADYFLSKNTASLELPLFLRSAAKTLS